MSYQLREKEQRGRDTDSLGRYVVLPPDRADLPRRRRGKSGLEVAEAPIDLLIAPLGFHHEDRAVSFDDDEIDFAPVGIPEITELDVAALDILLKVDLVLLPRARQRARQ